MRVLRHDRVLDGAMKGVAFRAYAEQSSCRPSVQAI